MLYSSFWPLESVHLFVANIMVSSKCRGSGCHFVELPTGKNTDQRNNVTNKNSYGVILKRHTLQSLTVSSKVGKHSVMGYRIMDFVFRPFTWFSLKDFEVAVCIHEFLLKPIFLFHSSNRILVNALQITCRVQNGSQDRFDGPKSFHENN